MTQAIFFDMDGLLIDSGPIWKAAYEDVLSKRGLVFGDEQYLQTAGMRLKEATKYWSDQGLYPAEDCQTVIDEIHAYVMQHIAVCPYMDGAESMLSYVQEIDIPIALVSASEKMVVLHVIEARGWHTIFDCIVTGEDVTRSKPDPEAYLHAAKELAVKLPECIIFEDSIPGVGAGVASGAKTIAIPKQGVATAAVMESAWRTYPSLADISREDFNSFIQA